MRHPTQLHAGDLVWPQIKILVFSLDDAFRFLARQTFRKMNVKDVLSTSIPEDAEHLAGYGPDIALVDFDGDGHAALAFLTRLRAAPRSPNPDLPVLVLVKNADRAAVTPAFHVGIEGVVPKPVSGHELTIRVTETLKVPQRMPVPNAPPAPKPVVAAAPAPAPAPPKEAPAPPKEATAPKVFTPPPGKPVAAAPVTIASPAGGGGAVEAAAPRPPVAKLAGDDLALAPVKKPAAGKLDAADIPAPAPKPKPAAIEVREQLAAKAPAQYRLDPKGEDEAARRKAEARKAAWEQELAKAGHRKRKGADVAALDVSAILAAHLAWLTSQGAEGARANFQGMDLAGADVSRAVLANASFREVDLSDALLAESRLDGCDFRYAKLGAVNLAGANLGVAQLRHADLRLANLEGAVLRGADLSGARLRGAKLAGADLKGATMISTDLSEADLSQVEGLTQAQADRTICDMKTKMPPGVMRPRKDE